MHYTSMIFILVFLFFCVVSAQSLPTTIITTSEGDTYNATYNTGSYCVGTAPNGFEPFSTNTNDIDDAAAICLTSCLTFGDCESFNLVYDFVSAYTCMIRNIDCSSTVFSDYPQDRVYTMLLELTLSPTMSPTTPSPTMSPTTPSPTKSPTVFVFSCLNCPDGECSGSSGICACRFPSYGVYCQNTRVCCI